MPTQIGATYNTICTVGDLVVVVGVHVGEEVGDVHLVHAESRAEDILQLSLRDETLVSLVKELCEPQQHTPRHTLHRARQLWVFFNRHFVF